MYNNIINVRNTEIKFRKWKVKDKKKFKSAISIGDPKERSKLIDEALVYDCLENPNTALSMDEFKYVLINIRKVSYEEFLNYVLRCDKCDKDYNVSIPLDELFIPEYTEYDTIEYDGIKIKMGEIRNKNFYKEELAKFNDPEEMELFDFIMHVVSYNGDETFSFEEITSKINDWDISTAIKIFGKWNKMKFTVSDKKMIKCPECNHEEEFIFNHMPKFLPDDWK